jgi:hypothetical protein
MINVIVSAGGTKFALLSIYTEIEWHEISEASHPV